MNKMAMFVEGRTELEFDSKLIQEIARPKGIEIKAQTIRGGRTTPQQTRQIWTIDTTTSNDTPTHFFLLVDCGNDVQTKSRMLEQYPTLVKSGFREIICHRDVAPDITRADLPTLERGLRYKVKTIPVTVKFILSVMEVEAWFLAEHTHFERIDPSITIAAIIANLGFDPSTDHMQDRAQPARDLGDCYALVGKIYDKLNTSPTNEAIDYAQVYLETADKFSHLRLLCDKISDFLDS